jgi:predicted nucleic acid-binding protein
MDKVAFDAEALIAYYWDEPGSDAVDEIINDLEAGEVKAFVNTVTCTEIQYVCGRDDRENARSYVQRVREWCDVVPAEDVWQTAADYKREHTIPLGDAFTLATAATREATAYTGADSDFDGIDVPVERFRQEAAD